VLERKLNLIIFYPSFPWPLQPEVQENLASKNEKIIALKEENDNADAAFETEQNNQV